MSTSTLSISNVSKSYSGIPILQDVSLDLAPGTFVAIAGENGAGKSTLLKIVSGMIAADGGSVTRGDVTVAGTPSAGRAAGVALVPQELEPLPEMSVAENIFLAHEPAVWGFVKRREMKQRAREMMARFGLDLDPSAKVSTLSIGNVQLLEIIKAVASGADFILLDEPTSSLSEHEVERLFSVLRQLRSEGLAAMFTTHKMPEIRALADRVVVLRDGRLTLDEALEAVSDDDIVTSMIGRELGTLFPAIAAPRKEIAFEAVDIEVVPGAASVSLYVRAGEIVGLAGLVGAGRTEFLESVFGVRRRRQGEVRVRGQEIRPNSIVHAIRSGLALVPEERKSGGLVLEMSVVDNSTLASMSALSRLGFLLQRTRRDLAKGIFERLQLRYRGLGQKVSTLSGGNQQKVVFGRWLVRGSGVLLLDEPTRGVDIGARGEIYKIIADLATEGSAVVLASSDMNEVLGLSHRVVVFAEGAVVGELHSDDLRSPDIQERIFSLASKRGEAEVAVA